MSNRSVRTVRGGAGLRACQVQQLVDQVPRPADPAAQLVETSAQVLVVGGRHRVLQLEGHRGQWSAQLMSSLGDEESLVVDRVLGAGELRVRACRNPRSSVGAGVDVDRAEVTGSPSTDVVGQAVDRRSTARTLSTIASSSTG